MITCWHFPMTDKCYLKREDETEEITGITREFVEELLCENERLRNESVETQGLLVDMFRDFANEDYELKRRCGRTFMAVTRYLPRLQELGIEVAEK